MLAVGALAGIAWPGNWPSLSWTEPGARQDKLAAVPVPGSAVSPAISAPSAPADAPPAAQTATQTQSNEPAPTVESTQEVKPAKAAAITPDAESAKLPVSASTVEPSGPVPESPVVDPNIGKLTLERLEAGKAWLEKMPDDRWFIQIFSTQAGRHTEIEDLLRRLPYRDVDKEKIHVYYSKLSGEPRYGIMYGDYPTRTAASSAMRKLPKSVLANKPYPRKVVRLR